MYSWSFKKDLNKGTLEPSHPVTMPTYSIETKRNVLNHSRKQTQLIPIGVGLGGAILWKDKSIQVGGTAKKLKRIRDKHRGRKHVREWHWADPNSPYIIEYDHGEWKATLRGNNQPCAVFTKKKSHLLRSSEPATITFFASLPAEEVTFLLLIMMYSEIARAEKIVEGIQTASDVIDIASNVVS